MSAYVLGDATHPPSQRESSLRLEEMAYHTAHAALDPAGVTRRQLDSVTHGAPLFANWQVRLRIFVSFRPVAFGVLSAGNGLLIKVMGLRASFIDELFGES